MALYITQEEKDRQQQNASINRATFWNARKQPCAECGLKWHPACMTFDHGDRRTVTKNKNAKNINAIFYWNPMMFNRQLKAGQIICKNCHFIREMKRDIDGPMAPKYYKAECREYFDICKGALVTG